MARHQLLDPAGKAPLRRVADLQPEAAQNTTQAVLDVLKLRLHELARGKHCACLLRPDRFAMYRPEPAQPHQLGNPARIVTIGLHRHRLECVTYVPGLQ